ncbi:MAG: DUF5985 family protein [Allosphingosinicella sp.]
MADIFPAAVYILCFLTSSACGLLLARNYRRTRAPLLLWSAFCFVLLAANNLVVVLDIIVLPGIDFRLVRHLLSLGAVSVLLFGFIWDLEE